jgi:hypothetical protein
MGSGEWGIGLRIADCGLRIDKTINLNFKPAVKETHKSAIRNLYSHFAFLTLLPFWVPSSQAIFGHTKIRVAFSGNKISNGTSRLGYEEQETRSGRRNCFRHVDDRLAAPGAIVFRRCGLWIVEIRNPQSAIRNQTLGVHRAYAPRLAAGQKRKLGQDPDRSVHPREVGEGRFNATA